MSDSYRTSAGIVYFLAIALDLTVLSVIIIIGLYVGSIYIAFLSVCICAPILVLLILLKQTTIYFLSENGLVTKSLGSKDEIIPYSDIKSIKESNNPISAKALSTDRVEIKCRNNKSVYVSPTRKQEFIVELTLRIK
ncbi:MAG: PH domain-containing protein [Candidatus Methanoplasma sp.]|jgi:hypothetical protein|nr:PH domain-containing protein [Candidatus Methanoplasma sp.]